MRARVRVALVNFNPIWFVPGVRLFLAFLVFWLASPRGAFCAPKDPQRPPVGETIRVKVIRGGTADVTLKAFEGRGNPLAYQIVAAPRHGRLEDFRQADENMQGFASVVYVHGNDERSQEDEFAFKARSLIGGGVSSPIKVKVQVADEPPRLLTTPVIDFSAAAGESDLQQIILANEGGGLVEGRIAPKEPFHLEGEGRFSLGRGQSTNFIVRFSPLTAENVPPQKLSPAPSDPGVSVTLRGEAKVPFAAAADPLQLHPDGTREGTISISNLSFSPIAVEFSLARESAAKIPPHADIPGQGAAEIPIYIGPDRAGGEGELLITVSSPFHRQDLTVPVPAVPPRLQLVTPELDFRAGNEAKLVVKNAGGLEGRCSLELPDTIKSIEGAKVFVVQAGAERVIPLRYAREEKNAPSPEVLVVDLGKAGKVPVPLVLPDPAPDPVTAKPEPAPTPAPPSMPWKLNRDVKLETAGEKNFIAWRHSKKGWTNAALEIITPGGAQVYHAESGKVGWWEWLTLWFEGRTAEAKESWQEKERFFEDRLTLPDEKETEAAGAEPANDDWKREPVTEKKTGAARWRVTALSESKATRSDVSEDFSIDWQTLELIPSPGPTAAEAAPSPPSGETAPSELEPDTEPSQPRGPLAATREIVAATVFPERTRVRLNLAVEEDPRITNFRLERREIAAEEDPGTGIPTNPHFVPAPHAGKAHILATAAAEHEGKRLTVVIAEIDGLSPGTATFWRLVPLSEEEALTPTAEFPVATAPPWQFPWRNFLLCLMTAVLTVVLWLRHKQRKAEYR